MRAPRITIRRLMIAIAVVGLMLAVVAWALRPIENHVEIENRSGQTIAELRIEHSSRAVVLEDLPDGGWTSATFGAEGDHEFNLTGSLADGTRLKGKLGHVIRGMFGENARIIVREGGWVD